MLLSEIQWGQPLLAEPGVPPEVAVGKRMSPWLMWAVQSVAGPEQVVRAPLKLLGVAYFVACQENACRYCYGEARAVMKIWGYSERQIRDLEQEASLADGLTRRVVEFTRKLAKSNPTPAREDREALQREGLSAEAVSEIAACVAKTCFLNRLATFVALPPNVVMERLPEGPLGRLLPWVVRRKVVPRRAPPPVGYENVGPCAQTIAAGGNTHIAAWLRRITDGWLASPLLGKRCKLLMLAVVSRQLGSTLCEEEARQGLLSEGLAEEQYAQILATLSSPVLEPLELTLLRWTRETVWYEPRSIQDSNRRLMTGVGEERTLEAIGTAAICNSLARLSLVRQ
jgi:alkylhydroperoxidase family enzyme